MHTKKYPPLTKYLIHQAIIDDENRKKLSTRLKGRKPLVDDPNGDLDPLMPACREEGE